MLGGVAREPPRLSGQAGKRLPAHRLGSPPADRRAELAPDRVGTIEHVHGPGHPLDLSRRQAEHLAEVASRPARPVAGEGRDQGRPVLPVALVHARDQLLPDVAREVEVDVGRLGDLLVQESPQEQPAAHGVDVGEAGEIADDRADTRPAAPAGWEESAHRIRPPDLRRHLARQLEDVVVEQQEPGQLQRANQPQLLLEAPLRLAVLRLAGVAMVETRPADLSKRSIGVGVLRARVAVAEVAGEVELEPLGDPAALGDRLRMVARIGPRPRPA